MIWACPCHFVTGHTCACIWLSHTEYHMYPGAPVTNEINTMSYYANDMAPELMGQNSCLAKSSSWGPHPDPLAENSRWLISESSNTFFVGCTYPLRVCWCSYNEIEIPRWWCAMINLIMARNYSVLILSMHGDLMAWPVLHCSNVFVPQ